MLEFFPTAERYVKNTVVGSTNNYNYVYHYKDHLGNVRISYTVDPADSVLKILEENHYYPFGLQHQSYSAVQQMIKHTGGGITLVPVTGPDDLTYNYRYNGKEEQKELGLNITAMDWRHYEPAIGRFLTVDPEAEDSDQIGKSPYAFSFNNPILYNDPDGRNPIKKWLKKILKSFADDGVKVVAKNSKGQYKPVSNTQAKKILQDGGSVTSTSQGSNKKAKKLMKEANPESQIVRHDGHELKNAQGNKTGKTGMDHYQKKSGDGSHVFYDSTKKSSVVVGATTTNTSKANDETKKVAGKIVEVGAKASDAVENFGTNIFGDNAFGRFINEANPLDFGFSDLFKTMDDSLNKSEKK